MKVTVRNVEGLDVGEVELPAGIFQARINRDLMHQALVRQLANARAGTHKAKSRSEINRTTAKWYRQKGTGRARHGSKRAPIFVGGGVAHGPLPRSYKKDMPRKMRRAALRSALSAKARDGEIVVIDKLEVAEAKTRVISAIVEQLAGGESVLLLLSQKNEMLERSARNLPDVRALHANYLNIRDLLGFQRIVMPLDALEVIQGYLGSDKSEILEYTINESPAFDEEE